MPNASFIGFTGTPIEKDDVNTPAVFGDYIDMYDISRAVEDGATVPIYYESRLARIELDEDEKPKIDAEIAELTEDEAQTEQERLKRKWASVEALVGADKRFALVAEDMVGHFEARTAALDGKGMIVCMSRRICVALYNAIIKLRPAWHSDDDDAGAIKVVMTGAASDPLDWQAHIGKRPKARREGTGQAGQGRQGPAQTRHRARHVADRLRRALHAHDVCGQADEGPRADAGHRPRQSRVQGQARRPGRRLHRHRTESEKRARAVFRRRPRRDRHRRGAGHQPRW